MVFSLALAQARRKRSKEIEQSFRTWFDQALERPGATEYLLAYDYLVNLITIAHENELANVLEEYNADEIAYLMGMVIRTARVFPEEKEQTIKQRVINKTYQ